MNLKTKCACCGTEIDRFDICDVCGWQDDGVQNSNPDYKGGANQMSLNEAKEIYRAYQDRLSMEPCTKDLTEKEVKELKKEKGI